MTYWWKWLVLFLLTGFLSLFYFAARDIGRLERRVTQLEQEAAR